MHSRSDTRIRLKETSSLSFFYPNEVVFFVADGLGDSYEELDEVEIIDIGGVSPQPFTRMIRGAWKMYWAVRKVKPTIVHFHDPELMLIGLLFKLTGFKVIYDVHENVPLQIMTKHWIPLWLRKPLAGLTNVIESFSSAFFDYIVAATPSISNRFSKHKTAVVQNYPILSEMATASGRIFSDRPKHVAYVGSITEIRGARTMVKALEFTKPCVHLQVAGKFYPSQLEEELRQLSGWHRVEVKGWLDRQGVENLLGQTRAGLLVFHSAPNHVDAQPNKLFEYMAAGLPVIASDFPLWRQIIDGAGCGILVDPHDARAIAEAIDWVLDNPEKAESMGKRGRIAVEKYYNWSSEAEQLFKVYRNILQNT